MNDTLSRYAGSALGVLALALLMLVAACQTPEPEAQSLVVYSGRGKGLVEPLIEQFQEATGITVEVRFGGTAELAVALTEEGAQSPADVFWAQDGGALGAVHEAGLLKPLPDSLLSKVAPYYRNSAGTWVATSGRARTLAFSPARTDSASLPQHLFDLTDPQYQGRVGWAPGNASFQAHVTALRQLVGDDSTRAWLEAMQANGAKAYSNNRAILDGIAAGEVDLGLPNHYYLYGKKRDDADYPVEQTFFAPGDVGNLINIAGVGMLKDTAPARRFVAYLLTADAQRYFATETFEYAVVGPVAMDLLPTAEQVTIDLEALRDLRATLIMLRDVGLL